MALSRTDMEAIFDAGGGPVLFNGVIYYTKNDLPTQEYIDAVYNTFTGPPGESINPRGEWNNGTPYVIRDLVSYNGSSYVAIANGTNHLPTDTDFWMLSAEKGETGAQGEPGVDGTGDVNSDESSVTDSQIVVFSGTDGKTIKAGTGTGYVKSTSGVISTSSAIPATDVTEDSSHRFATDSEKSTWNGKQDALGFTAVPNTRTVNGYALSSNVTVSASDVGLGNVDNTSDSTKNSASVTLTNKTISGSANTISNIAESSLSISDNTTGNVSTSAHGFAPKGDGSTTKFLNANGAYSTPAAGLTIGTTAITSGTAGRFLYETSGNLVGETSQLTFDGTTLSLTPSVTTGTGSTSGLNATANSLTTGDGFTFSSSSLTSGNLFKIASTSTAAASGTHTVLNVSKSGTNGTSAQTTYAAKFDNSSAGTTSTNIGALFTASNGTTANYPISVENGTRQLRTGLGQSSRVSLEWLVNGTVRNYIVGEFGGGNDMIFGSSSEQMRMVHGGGLYLISGNVIGLGSATAPDVIIGRNAAATLRLGASDHDTTPVAQTLTVQGALTGGTNNVNGTNFTIKGSPSKGTGTGGSLIFQVTPAGSSGNSVNSHATALTIDSTKLATFAAGITSGSSAIQLTDSTGYVVAPVKPQFVATSDVTYASSTSELTLIGSGEGSLTLAANRLKAGTVIRIHMHGKFNYNSGSAIVRIKLGGTTVATITPNPSATGEVDIFDMVAELTCRTAGASGNVRCAVTYLTDDNTSNHIAKLWGTYGSVDNTIDTTGTLAIDVTGQYDTSNANNRWIVYETLIQVIG